MPEDSQPTPELLGEATWTVSELASDFTPRWTHQNKIAIALRATPPGTIHEGQVHASRWRGTGLPVHLSIPAMIVPERGFFAYPTPSPEDASVHWHMNFADPHLFGYGEGSLLAQDELQITEHPCLASVAYAIEKGLHGQRGLVRQTQEAGKATPVLIEGAPRRCALNTTHLYGDLFQCASENQVLEATEVLCPPSPSNIIALAALPPARGEYTALQIQQLFLTAYTGFKALSTRSGRVTLHTGHWGCGAFGGNKGLVAAIQLLAAGSAGVERVSFWWGFSEMDRSALDHAEAVARKLANGSLQEAVERLATAKYRWGQANENHVPFEPPARCLLQTRKPRASLLRRWMSRLE
jgi:hypothetical protein